MNARMQWVTKAALLALVALCAVSAPVVARTYKGTAKANKVVGTKKADKIALRGGNDRARGRGGNDRIAGGAGKDVLAGDAGKDRVSGDRGNDRVGGGSGNDRLNGGAGNDRVVGSKGNDRLVGGAGKDRVNAGKGKDRLSGGAGNDTLNSVDGKKDAAVNGGKGRNKCRIDAADLSVTKNCGSVTVAPSGTSPGTPGGSPGGGGPGGGGPGGVGLPGSPGGPGAPGTITLVQGSGLQCNALVPSCTFSLTIDPGSTPIGEVLAELGVDVNGDASLLSLNPLVQVGDNVVVGGVYVCTDEGALVVDFRDQHIVIPVACNRP